MQCSCSSNSKLGQKEELYLVCDKAREAYELYMHKMSGKSRIDKESFINGFILGASLAEDGTSYLRERYA